MKLPTKEHPRDRALTDDEIRWLWQAAEEVGWPFGPVTKLLLLTAQRRDEVANLEWSEIDLAKRVWTLPRDKAKNNRAHEVQLSELAIETLRSLPRVGDRYVFSTTGDGPVAGFSRAKLRIDAAMIAARRRELGLPQEENEYRRALGAGPDKPPPVEISHWIFHDLRRTAATGMARLNIAPHVVDKILNHVSGTIRGVAAVYNRFEYLQERRTALEAWGRLVSDLVEPKPTNVVAIRA